ncbi:Gfo/Idh/MocA family protein [Bacillus sp. REN16]|uniref:Gfo/Idh/MocA family protein n=1 Tax=Bacillus sp. REN16 TaxID=2887296 RepID=UPI001E56C35F|nr:Gfo/Idh/MocA family oxidoreductase [Bacillus sp. REN16]MCC3355951.1 Gfo/Idh/MocA family oxidoreductase [Bacillus sp. REN16]
MEKLRIGIIGAGGIAQHRHLPAFQKLSDLCEIQAICDVNMKRAQEVADTYNIPIVHKEYQDIFSEVDAVCICTPNKFHAEIAIAASEAGLHVFCEKPMALTAEECEAMISASNKAGKVLSVAYHYRFTREAQAAKKVMGEVGVPIVVRVRALRQRKIPSWGVFTNKELQGGGSLIDWGCHFLDLALWLIGNPTETEVSGSVYNHLSKKPNQVNEWGIFDHNTFEVDDHVSAYIKFENGTSMLFETSWAANIKKDDEHISISGVDGGLSVFPFELYTTQNGMLLNSTTPWLPGEEKPDLPQARNFIEACLGQAELVVKPEEALQVSRIIDQIYETGGTLS